MEDFSKLVCGSLNDNSDVAKVLAHLRKSIHIFSDKARAFLESDDNGDLLLFGPFSARVLMENSASALLGRIDPFRLVYLSRFQAQSQYDPTKRAKSAFNWQGDVMSAEKDKENLWSDELDLSKISRALFSQHVEHMFWRPATEASLDFAGTLPSTPAIAELLQLDTELFIASAKGRGNSIYSQLSKGVHWEFFSGASTAFDPATVRQVIRDAFVWVCRLAVVSHFLSNAHSCLSKHDAMQTYNNTMDAIHAR